MTLENVLFDQLEDLADGNGFTYNTKMTKLISAKSNPALNQFRYLRLVR